MTSPIKVNVTLYNHDGTWSARGDYKDPITGRRVRKSKTLRLKVANSTKRKAVAMLPEVKAQWEAELNSNVVSDDPTFAESVERWLEAKSKTVKENSMQGYHSYAKNHIIPMLGNIRVKDITYSRLQWYCDTMAKSLKPETIGKHFTLISGVLDDAMRDGIISNNPASLVKMPRAKEKFKGNTLTAGEAKTLLTAAKDAGEPIYTAILLPMVYGLRRSEVCGLRWQDIDFDNGVMHICNTVVKGDAGYIEEERTKTRKSDRVIALVDFTVPHFKALKEQQQKAGLTLGKVCRWPNGDDIKHDYISKKFGKLLKENGLPPIRYHDLRHTAASLLIASGATPQQTQEFLGHETVSTTMNIYAHCLSDVKVKTAKLMNDIYFS